MMDKLNKVVPFFYLAEYGCNAMFNEHKPIGGYQISFLHTEILNALIILAGHEILNKIMGPGVRFLLKSVAVIPNNPQSKLITMINNLIDLCIVQSNDYSSLISMLLIISGIVEITTVFTIATFLIFIKNINGLFNSTYFFSKKFRRIK